MSVIKLIGLVRRLVSVVVLSRINTAILTISVNVSVSVLDHT